MIGKKTRNHQNRIFFNNKLLRFLYMNIKKDVRFLYIFFKIREKTCIFGEYFLNLFRTFVEKDKTIFALCKKES